MKISKSNTFFVLLVLTTIAVVIGYSFSHLESSNEAKNVVPTADTTTYVESQDANEQPLTQGIEISGIYEQLTHHEYLDSLVSFIPNQGSIGPITAFTQEYYDTWTEAWEIPAGGLGELGNNEFLFHFVCGNDPCPKHTGKLDGFAVRDTVLMKFYIVHQPNEMATPKHKFHTLKLIYKDTHWLIADYDNTLHEMKTYIKEQRKYLLSEDYQARANDILQDPETSQDWKNAVIKELLEVSQYFGKHSKQL